MNHTGESHSAPGNSSWFCNSSAEKRLWRFSILIEKLLRHRTFCSAWIGKSGSFPHVSRQQLAPEGSRMASAPSCQARSPLNCHKPLVLAAPGELNHQVPRPDTPAYHFIERESSYAGACVPGIPTPGGGSSPPAATDPQHGPGSDRHSWGQFSGYSLAPMGYFTTRLGLGSLRADE